MSLTPEQLLAEIRGETPAQRQARLDLKAAQYKAELAAKHAKAPVLRKIKAWAEGAKAQLSYLYDRWLNEREHEDIEEYAKAIGQQLPEGWKVVKAHKRPFGVTLEVDGELIQIKVNSREISWVHRATKGAPK